MNSKQYINTEEFMDFIIKYINSNKLKEHFKNTDFYNEKNNYEYYNAMQHGLIWATTLMASSEISKYYAQQ